VGEEKNYSCEFLQTVPPRPSGQGRLETMQKVGKWRGKDDRMCKLGYKQDAEGLGWILNCVFLGLRRGEMKIYSGLSVGGNFEIKVGRAVW